MTDSQLPICTYDPLHIFPCLSVTRAANFLHGIADQNAVKHFTITHIFMYTYMHILIYFIYILMLNYNE